MTSNFYAHALAKELTEVDAALASGPTSGDRLRRGRILLELARATEALPELEAAIALDPTSEPAHYFAGVALGALGRHADAIAAWERALPLSGDRPDTHYNIAQARFLLKDFEGALAGFRTVTRLDPTDFMTLRKVAQCCYALGRNDEGQAARVSFRDGWSTTKDPRARFITEYVFDQFEGDGFWVHAAETLRPSNPTIYAVLTFRAVEQHGHHEHALPASVLIETSDQARAAGTPFVIGVKTARQFRVIATAKELPLYADLKREVVRLLREAIASLRTPQP